MPSHVAGMTRAPHAKPTVMEKRVSPEARIGASDIMRPSFERQRYHVDARAVSAAMLATAALSVKR